MPSPDELQPAPVADAAEDSAPDAPATEPSRAQNLRTSRMEVFSDGVFAIAITLLVLEIAVPVVAGADLLRGVEERGRRISLIVSFSTIGAVWPMHSLITEFLDHADQVFLRLNLLLLLVVCFPALPHVARGAFAGRSGARTGRRDDVRRQLPARLRAAVRALALRGAPAAHPVGRDQAGHRHPEPACHAQRRRVRDRRRWACNGRPQPSSATW